MADVVPLRPRGPVPPRREPRVLAQLCRMPGRIGCMIADRLTPPDAMGDQYMPLAYLVVRDRAECFLPGTAERRGRQAANED